MIVFLKPIDALLTPNFLEQTTSYARQRSPAWKIRYEESISERKPRLKSHKQNRLALNVRYLVEMAVEAISGGLGRGGIYVREIEKTEDVDDMNPVEIFLDPRVSEAEGPGELIS